jgi:1-acyl-sn-glycerol-3-phosphate acyltransferase
MAAGPAQADIAAAREQVLAIVRELLEELGSLGAVPLLRAESNLDRDLGLGSLERVELMARIEAAFGVRLPDRVAAEANTPTELASAVLMAPAGISPRDNTGSAVRAAATAETLRRNAAEAGVFSAETLIDVLRYRAAHDAERIHLDITEDAEGGERNLTVTFGELHAAAQRLAEELARRHVGPGARVALMLPTSRAFFVCYAGILLAGAVPVPIYPPFRADRIEEYAARQAAILNNAEACLLLTFHQAEAVARLLKPRVRSLLGVLDAEKLIAASERTPETAPGALPAHLSGSRNRKASDLALLQYTSGSTGNPKGVMLTHANLLANIRAMGEAVRMGPGDVGVSWLPLYHDMGLIGAWLTLLYYGVPLVVMSPLAFITRPERWLWAFHKHGGTIAAAPNFAYERCASKIADKDIAGLNLSTWRAALNGAEPVNPETLERFAARFAAYGFRREAQMPVYGLAESSLAVTAPPPGRGPLVDRIERETFESTGRAVPAAADDESAIAFVSSGSPLAGHEVRIVNDKDEEAPERTEGFLWFRGPSATAGYYRNAEATESLLPCGASEDGGFAWVNSGDRAYRADGEIYVTGRVKDIIIKGGRNLYPHEVEDLAGRAAGVRKGCVVAFGVKDEGSGTEKMIVVAESRERDAAKRAGIASRVTEEVAHGLGLPPDRVELLPLGSIPKTSSGKLRREETKRLYIAGALAASKPPAWLQIMRLGAGGAIRSAGSSLWAALKRGMEIAYGAYFCALFAAWIAPAWLMLLGIRERRAAGRYTSAALKVLFALGGISVRVSGRENMAAPGAKVYVSNHASYFDVLALMEALGVSYHFIAKKEVLDMPLIGTFLRRMGHFSFDRSDAGARVRQAQEMKDALERGESLFVFPEGTFTADEGIRHFQLGAFKAAAASGAPVIPVSLAGTRRFLRDGTYLPRPTSVTITVSAPILPAAMNSSGDGESGDWHELVQLRDMAREAIAAHAGEPLL